MVGEPAFVARWRPGRGPAFVRRASGALLLTVLLGCTAPAKYALAPGHEEAPGVERVLLCPLNVAVALPSEIVSGVAPVYEEIDAYLGAQDLVVQELGLAEARTLWREAAEKAHRTGSQDAGAIFAGDLGRQIEFDAVVMPSLILRSVRVTDSSGTWDGVRRRVSTVNRPHRGQGVEADSFSKGIAFGGMTGMVMAASLHVMTYLRDGRLVFEGVGGIDFVQEADLSGAGGWNWELRANPDLMRRPDAIKEGVRIAFGPYLPPRSGR